MVACVDDQVGRIVAALEKRGLRNNTLIAFSSDNGGPLGLGATNGQLRAGKHTLYEGGVRVSAFANWPGKIAAGGAVTQPLHIVDWYPTMLKLAGAKLDQKLPLDGRDAWATIAEGQPTPHEEILHNTTPGNGAIRMGDWKLVLNAMRPEDWNEGPAQPAKAKKGKKKAADGGDSIELFNIKDDPYEKTNLADKEPEKVRQLKARLDAYAREAAPPKSAAQSPDFKVPKVWGESS
jgi:arylsulfatase A-like enzyme